MNFRKYVVQYGKTKEGGFNMSKVCPKCGREFENRSANCPICKCALEEIGVKKTSAGSTAGTRAVQNAQARHVQARAPQTRSAYQEPQKEKPSGLSITALVFSLLGCLSVVGLVLGIVDLCVNKQRKKVCSVLALVFSGLWIVGIAAIVSGGDSSQSPKIVNNPNNYIQSDSKGYVSENEAIGNSAGESVSVPSTNNEYKIGETWVVDGQWKLTVNSVYETDDRNQFSEKKPSAVYIVTYTYENIGYEDKSGFMDGLFISLDDTIVDSTGKMGYSYPADKEKFAQETPVGATCEAQVCIGVDNPGSFKLYVDKYDGNGDEHKAIFLVEP